MPVITVGRDHLFEALGRKYTDEEFEDLCFEFGIELDDITTEREMKMRETGQETAKDAGKEEDEILYKIDIPANRYDLLCLEGLSQALNVFLGRKELPNYTIKNVAEKREQIIVKPETAQIRPHVVGAILRNVTFTQLSYNSFLDLQDKLHQNICRRRALVAIGTHDYDTIQGPFTYEAVAPSDIKFHALMQTEEKTAEELMSIYRADNKMKQYVPIIENSPVYPMIYDSNRVVLSMPPMINGDHSKINLNTKNVFIECTATDLSRAKIVLNTIIAMFSVYCGDQFTAEEVEVVYPDGAKHTYPDLELKSLEVDTEYIKSITGIPELTVDTVLESAKKMGLLVAKKDEEKIEVTVPITRNDVLHACDVAEDIAIGYGYNNIKANTQTTMTVGKQNSLNKLSDLIRQEVAFAGYTEALTWALCSEKEVGANLRREYNADVTVKIGNPKTAEFQIARCSLLGSLLRAVSGNKTLKLPIKMFEVSDVLMKDASVDVGARNERHLVAAYSNITSGFSHVHGLLDTIMLKLGYTFKKDYSLETVEDPAFFPGLQAQIKFRGQAVGHMGVVHPEVLKNYKYPYPASAIELNLEPLIKGYFDALNQI